MSWSMSILLASLRKLAGRGESALAAPNSCPARSACPFCRSHLGQSRQPPDDAKSIIHPLHVLPEMHALLVERLRLLRAPGLMQPALPHVDQEHPQPPSIPRGLEKRQTLLIEGARRFLLTLGQEHGHQRT